MVLGQAFYCRVLIVALVQSKVWDAWTFFKLLDMDSGGAVEVEEFLMGCALPKAGRCRFENKRGGVVLETLGSRNSLPELVDFKLFGKTILVVYKKFKLFLASQLGK